MWYLNSDKFCSSISSQEKPRIKQLGFNMACTSSPLVEWLEPIIAGVLGGFTVVLKPVGETVS